MDEFDEIDIRLLWACVVEQAIDDLVYFAQLQMRRKLWPHELKEWNSAFGFLFDGAHMIGPVPAHDLLHFIDWKKAQDAAWRAVFIDRKVPEMFATQLQRAIERVKR